MHLILSMVSCTLCAVAVCFLCVIVVNIADLTAELLEEVRSRKRGGAIFQIVTALLLHLFALSVDLAFLSFAAMSAISWWLQAISS